VSDPRSVAPPRVARPAGGGSWSLGIVGAPVAHSLSPTLHGAGLASLGLLGGYTAYEARDEAALAAVVGRLRAGELHGLNVTIPWKVAVVEQCDALEGDAEALGAVNTLVRLEDGRIIGHNTDVWGLEAAVRSCDPPAGPGEDRGVVTVVGAGGAARAAVQVAFNLGAREVRVWNRTASRAESLVEAMRRGPLARSGGPAHLSAHGSLMSALHGAQLVLQASAWGMEAASGPTSHALPRLLGLTAPGALVVDLVYAAWGTPSRATPWVEAAAVAQRSAIDGLAMLVLQAARAFWLWTGLHPDLDALWRAADGRPGRTTPGFSRSER
jgi:shikimate dehydrogenase